MLAAMIDPPERDKDKGKSGGSKKGKEGQPAGGEKATVMYHAFRHLALAGFAGVLVWLFFRNTEPNVDGRATMMTAMFTVCYPIFWSMLMGGGPPKNNMAYVGLMVGMGLLGLETFTEYQRAVHPDKFPELTGVSLNASSLAFLLAPSILSRVSSEEKDGQRAQVLTLASFAMGVGLVMPDIPGRLVDADRPVGVALQRGAMNAATGLLVTAVGLAM